MRRSIKSLLLALVALLYAGSASAYTLSVTGPTSANASDEISVDVVLDSEEQALYGYIVNVYFDPAVLSVVDGTYHPITGENYGSLYMYPDNWYVSMTAWAVVGPVNQSIATLVFHVTDVGGTMTDITPTVTTLMGYDGTDFSAVTTLVPLSIQVPEPTGAALVLSAIGTLAIFWARRGRAR